jgi:succinate-acetate transporter protein
MEEKLANPAPLGLMDSYDHGLLNIPNAGFFPVGRYPRDGRLIGVLPRSERLSGVQKGNPFGVTALPRPASSGDPCYILVYKG